MPGTQTFGPDQFSPPHCPHLTCTFPGGDGVGVIGLVDGDGVVVVGLVVVLEAGGGVPGLGLEAEALIRA